MKNSNAFRLSNFIGLGVLLLFYFGIHPIDVLSQERSFGLIPILKAKNPTPPATDNLNNTRDYQKILKIYNKLVDARGDYRYPVPPLFLKEEERYVASINYNTNEITLEKKAYDTVKQFGDVGIAFLLGHELTHYYEKHAWRGAFAHDNADLKVGKNLRDLQDHVANETEADYLGGFLAYTAGYGMFDKGDEVISALYKAYGLDDKLEGYPSKKDRIELSKRSAKKLESLIDAFEVANLFVAIQKYDLAQEYYNYILKHFQSRELYNNAGVATVLNAIQWMDEDSLTYKYVTTLDVKFKGSRDVENLQDSLFKKAILHFNTAINLDPSYAPAYLNKANAYALLRDYPRAEFYLNFEAEPIAKKNPELYSKTLLDITVLRGIIAAKKGNEAEAKELFLKAKNAGSDLAATNLAILNKEEITIGANTERIDGAAEKIGAISLDDYLSKSPLFDSKPVIGLQNGNTFFQYNPKDSDCKIYLNQLEREGKKKIYYTFMITKDGYSGSTSKGISIGDSEDKLTSDNNYGQPPLEIPTVAGKLLVYIMELYFL